MSDLVRNPEDRFSRFAAHICIIRISKNIDILKFYNLFICIIISG